MNHSKFSDFSVVILAAGKGKRMNNPDLAKVMALLGGKPLIAHVLDTVAGLQPNKTVVVVGNQKQSVIDFVNSRNESNIFFAEQNEQLGTGHAVAQADSFFVDYDGDILILAGDVPLLTSETLIKFAQNHYLNKADVSVLSTFAPDPTGYGRIIRTSDRSFLKIVEHKDATELERQVNEINSGIFLVSSKLLFSSLKNVSNSNSQGEYYLTDIVEILHSSGYKVIAFAGADFDELQGINTPVDLARAEVNLKARR